MSQKALYELYKQGVDTLYWRGIPVVKQSPKARKKIQSKKPKKQHEDRLRQAAQQAIFGNYMYIWKVLSPTTKKFFKQEAKKYDMSGKDLFFYLMMKLYAHTNLPENVLADYFFYIFKNKLYIDILSTASFPLEIANLPAFPPPIEFYEKRRGVYKRCKRPIEPIEGYYVRYPVFELTQMYLINPVIVAVHVMGTGPRTFYFSPNPFKASCEAWAWIYQNWKYLGPSSMYSWALDRISFINITRSYGQAMADSWLSVCRYDLSRVPQLEKYRAIFMRAVGNPYQEEITGNAIKPKQNYYCFAFGPGVYFVPPHQRFIMFPKIPANFMLPNVLYLTVFFPPYVGLPERCCEFTGDPLKSDKVRREILNTPQHHWDTFLIKGRYRTFRIVTDPPPSDEYFAVVYHDPITGKRLRLSPIFRGKDVKDVAFKIEPPDVTFYERYGACGQDIQLKDTPMPITARDVYTHPWEDKYIILEKLRNVYPGPNVIWFELYREHLKQNPKNVFRWEEDL